MTLSQKIESYLFYTGEPVSAKKLAAVFGVSENDIQSEMLHLEETLQGHGIVLIKNADQFLLATHPDAGDMIREIKKQELSDPLSKSALETLAIILYQNGTTKPEIDFIRGVNSGFMLRNLLVRGLIEKIPNPDDKRITKYRATFDTLQHLGISEISQLPNFETFKEELAKRESVEQKTEPNVFTD